MIKIGFSGTRRGMTEEQKEALIEEIVFFSSETVEFHHGDCLGADEQADQIFADCTPGEIHVHPPTAEAYRAYTQKRTNKRNPRVVWPPEPFLKRDAVIAQLCDILIATPKTYSELVRSGTWTTIRRARSCKKKIHIIYPDGTVLEEVNGATKVLKKETEIQTGRARSEEDRRP